MSSLAARLLVVLAALTAIAVSACSAAPENDAGQASTTTSPAADHNADDVAFLQNMIPHHQQALELAALVDDRTADPELTELAQQITDEQDPEIQAFRAQLTQWEVAPAAPDQPMTVHGMVDAGTMDKLTRLEGAEFDTLWLQSMIAHHQGAIDMAKTEIASGQSADIIAMAHSIVESQQAEIEQMHQMLEGQ